MHFIPKPKGKPTLVLILVLLFLFFCPLFMQWIDYFPVHFSAGCSRATTLWKVNTIVFISCNLNRKTFLTLSLWYISQLRPVFWGLGGRSLALQDVFLLHYSHASSIDLWFDIQDPFDILRATFALSAYNSNELNFQRRLYGTYLQGMRWSKNNNAIITFVIKQFLKAREHSVIA